ncbi:MAG TPA: tripartite tricarboxylate transporter substrate binding protein [Xanthobacteraceae bacterium]|nr:tripartite tricarboxylate transporter substrate binding protein [Xanthobacteraceae bacterium]
MKRRAFLHLAAGAAALPAISRGALALDYPTRPVRWIVGYPPGSGADTFARLIGQPLSERLGQPVVIENRPGAGTNIGTEAVVHAAPDGYTLLLVSPPNAVNATLYLDLKFNFLRDIVPVASFAQVPNVMVVDPSFPAKTLPEFIAYAKANPGKVDMASSGTGSASHLSGELFKSMAGINMLHVPYRGSPAILPDLFSGRVQVTFNIMSAFVGYIRAGKLRALGVTTAARSEALPDVPAVGEFVPGYEMSNWEGVGAPKNTPAEIVDKLNNEINAVISDSNMKARFADLGATALIGSPAEFGKLIANETEKWGKVIRAADIKPE